MSRRPKPYKDRRNGVWVAAITVGYDSKGRAIRRKRSSKSHEEALRFLVEMEAAVRDGRVPTRPDTVSVAEWLARWLEHAQSTVNANSFVNYRGIVKNHVAPRIGKVSLQKVTPLILDGLFSSLEKDGVGRRVQQIVHVVCNQAFERAVTLELLAFNPMSKIKRPKIDRSKKKAKPTWTAEEVWRFLQAASDHELAAFFVLAATTGARQSELFALMRTDIDLHRKTMRIERGLHEIPVGDQKEVDPLLGPGLVFLATKSESSTRTIALPDLAVNALQGHLQSTTGPLLFTYDGRAIRARTFTSAVWKPLLRQAGVPMIPFKQLRHTCLTILAEEGVPTRAAQALAGHSSSALTAEVYQQATARLARGAADAWDVAMEREGTRAEARAKGPQQTETNEHKQN